MVDSLERFGLEMIKDWTFNKGDLEFNVRGTQIMLRSADEPSKLRGLSINYFLLDEAREFKSDEVFTTLLARIRESEEDFWAIASTTRGKNWFFDVIKKEGLEHAFTTGYAYNQGLTVVIQATRENPFLPKAYLAELEQRYSGKLAEQELQGGIVDWSAGVFVQSWFQDRALYWRPTYGVRAWDIAVSTKTSSDFSAGVLMARKGQTVHICDLVHEKVNYVDLKELIYTTAMKDGPGITIVVESVGTQVGIVQDLQSDRRLASFKVIGRKVTKDKLSRALPMAPRFEQGTLKLCAGTWNQTLIDEMCSFSGDGTGHDDIVDACSIAWESINVDPLVRPINNVSRLNVDEIKLCQLFSSIEIVDFQAYMIKALWHPHRELLEIVDEQKATTIEDISGYLRPAKRRVGGKNLDSDSLKNISMALVKAQSPVVTGDLDDVGSVYYLNQLITGDKFYIPIVTRTYSDLIASDKESELSPFVKCLLRIVQECRSWKKPEPKVYGPFEKQREVAKKIQAAALIPQTDWVGT